ncbi:MAG: HEAT repeat domain-containing protein [Verrucomicrobia bacterium]|nr:HEAT repeat domain-containing protein [Verrucomicrobiota bacterium]
MGEIKARVDALIVRLGDLDNGVRLAAIEELSTLDKDHALPALHWAIENELDDAVRNAARDAYQKLSRIKAIETRAANGKAGDRTRSIDRPKVRAVVMEEGAFNPWGSLSFKVGLIAVALLAVWVLLDAGQYGDKTPFLTWWFRIVGGVAFLGLALGIVGVNMRGEHHIPAIIGIVFNGFVVLIFFASVIVPLIRRLLNGSTPT